MGVDTASAKLYKDTYDAWLAKMTPEELRQAKAMGIDKPARFHERTAVAHNDDDTAEFDPTDSYVMTRWRYECLSCEVPEDLSEKRKSDWEFVERLVAEFLDAEDAILARDCFLYLIGSYMMAGVTLETLAQKRGITKEAFLSHANAMKKRLSMDVSDETQVELYGTVGHSLLVSKNPRLAFDILAIACGLSASRGISIRKKAVMYGVTPQAISKRAVALRKRLGLPMALGGKSEAACEKYRICNVRNYGPR